MIGKLQIKLSCKRHCRIESPTVDLPDPQHVVTATANSTTVGMVLFIER